jgi:ATP-dependent Lon protease
VGTAVGLAWTEVGGEMLAVEATTMPGKGNLLLTGKLGEVMQESAKAALSYIRAHAVELGIKPDFYEKVDIHVHLPEGAIPKDGPSAGVTMITALVSALSGRPVRRDIAMTGEITLRGHVLKIGGLKEKVIAAHRAEIPIVVIPHENEDDLEEISLPIRKQMEFIKVKDVAEVLKIALYPVAETASKEKETPEKGLAKKENGLAVEKPAGRKPGRPSRRAPAVTPIPTA